MCSTCSVYNVQCVYLDHAGEMSLQFWLEAGERFTGPMQDKVRQIPRRVPVHTAKGIHMYVIYALTAVLNVLLCTFVHFVLVTHVQECMITTYIQHTIHILYVHCTYPAKRECPKSWTGWVCV